jgi:hypothetical protein
MENKMKAEKDKWQQQRDVLNEKMRITAAKMLQSNIRKRQCRNMLNKKKREYEEKLKALQFSSSDKMMEDMQELKAKHDRERLQLEAKLVMGQLETSGHNTSLKDMQNLKDESERLQLESEGNAHRSIAAMKIQSAYRRKDAWVCAHSKHTFLLELVTMRLSFHPLLHSPTFIAYSHCRELCVGGNNRKKYILIPFPLS